MIPIIIPAYKPDHNLVTLVTSLTRKNFPLIVINDGSGEAFDPIFNLIEKNPRVTLLHHSSNQGKGQALKTGFQYFLNHGKGPGIITADSDGQHLVPDIIKLSECLQKKPTHIWLGARTFAIEQRVPWRSRFGNRLTRFCFKWVVGQSLQDTQTGLRGLPRFFLKDLMTTQTYGYEFELEMLIRAAGRLITINEVPIKTIYKNANKNSHFHPLKDSVKIYLVFLKYLIPSLMRNRTFKRLKIGLRLR